MAGMVRLPRWLYPLLMGFFVVLAGLSPLASAQGQAGAPVVPATAQALLDAVNALRSANGLPPYRTEPILMTIAQAQAEYMASIGTWTHTGPDGSRPYQRALAAGYLVAGDLSQGGWFSENVIMGNNLSAEAAVQAWLGDDAHRNTMLSTIYQDAGAGVAVAGSTYYYCLDVGLSTGGTPVVFTPFGHTPTPTILPNTPNPDGSIVHIVRPGEILLAIAVAYNVPLEDVLRLNNLTVNSIIYPDQKIVIRPAFTPTPTQPTATASPLPTLTPWPTSTRTASPAVAQTATPAGMPARPLSGAGATALVGLILLLALALAALVALFGRGQRPYDKG